MFDEQKFNEAFAEVMKEGLDSEEGRHAIAKKIVKFVQDDIQQRDLAAMMLPKETIPLGTTAEYAVRNKLRAYWHEPGSYAPRTRLTQRVMTIPTALISAHPEYELGQLEAGRYGGVAEQVRLATDALLGAINAKVWNTLVGAVAATDANYGTVAYGLGPVPSTLKTAIDLGINWVEDQPGGGARAIVGRRNVLYRMLDIGTTGTVHTGAISDSTQTKIDNTGSLPTYRGIPLIGLMQYVDGFGKHTIAQDEILIIGGDVGKYVVSQELRSKDAIEVDTLVWHLHMYTRVGVGVLFPKRLFRIKLIP